MRDIRAILLRLDLIIAPLDKLDREIIVFEPLVNSLSSNQSLRQ